MQLQRNKLRDFLNSIYTFQPTSKKLQSIIQILKSTQLVHILMILESLFLIGDGCYGSSRLSKHNYEIRICFLVLSKKTSDVRKKKTG